MTQQAHLSYPAWPGRPAWSTARFQREPGRGGSPRWTPAEPLEHPHADCCWRPPKVAGCGLEGQSDPHIPGENQKGAKRESAVQPSCCHAGTTWCTDGGRGQEGREAGKNTHNTHTHTTPWAELMLLLMCTGIPELAGTPHQQHRVEAPQHSQPHSPSLGAHYRHSFQINPICIFLNLKPD